MGPARAAVAISLVAVTWAPAPAIGATAGQPIADNDYSIELYLGPVVGSNRTISMAGAYAAVAEGAEGIFFNPASLAARWPYSHSWYDWDVSADFYLAGFGARNDLDFDGSAQRGSSGLLAGAGALQFGWWGFGATLFVQTVDFALADGKQVRSTLSQLTVGMARGLFDGQLLVGIGVAGASFELQLPESKESLIKLESGEEANFLGGVAWRPRRWPLRVGASVQAPIGGERLSLPAAAPGEDVVRIADRAVPSSIQVPAKVSLGAAISFGPRIFNPRWVNPRTETRPFTRGFAAEREVRQQDHERAVASLSEPGRDAAQQRFDAEEERRQDKEDEILEKIQQGYVADAARRYREASGEFFLLALELQIIGASGQPATGVDGFLAQALVPKGRQTTVQPRVGLETEPWRDVLRLRGGNYLEQSRFNPDSVRLHQTLGFDYHLYDYADWLRLRLSGLLDLAPGYLNVGLSLGLWK